MTLQSNFSYSWARLRSLLAACLCLFFSQAMAQSMGLDHDALLTRQLESIEPSRGETANLYVLSAALSSQQDVFRNDVVSMRDLLDRLWHTSGRSVALVADEPSKSQFAYPTRSHLRMAAKGLAKKMNSNKDVLLLFLTSHGAPAGMEVTVPGESRFMFSAVDVRQLLEATGAKYRVVVLSACHAGALVNELADEHTLVMAAAAADRTSFGCSSKYAHTWFTEALMNALATTPKFATAFRIASQKIRQYEDGGEAFEHSNPQITVGASMGSKLAEIEAQAEAATDWEPPFYKTDEGRARRLLGDYLSLVQDGAGDTQIRWLILTEVGIPVDGIFPISAWSRSVFRGSGSLQMSFDPRAGTLTGSGAPLLNAKLAVGDGRLSGTAQFGDITFTKVARREVYDAIANHPRPKTKADAQSVIRLLYIGASDCAACVQWEREHIENGLLTKMPEYPAIELVKSRRYSLRSKLQKDDLPASVQSIYETLEKDKGMSQLLSHAPSFALLVNDTIRVWSVGPFLDTPIYPVLRAAVREKQAAAMGSQ